MIGAVPLWTVGPRPETAASPKATVTDPEPGGNIITALRLGFGPETWLEATPIVFCRWEHERVAIVGNLPFLSFLWRVYTLQVGYDRTRCYG